MKMIMLLMLLADTEIGPTSTPDVQLLDFTASYCQPCQQMVPILQRMERDRFPVRQIDITEEHELARRFNVDRVPTLVLLVEGKEAKRFVGLTDEAELRSEMNKAARRLAESRGQQATPASEITLAEPTSAQSNAAELKTAAIKPQDAPAERSPLSDVFRKLIPGTSRTTSLEFPDIRGQSPEAAAEALKGIDAAAAATVRVRVAGTSTKDGAKVQDVGTGTIVYSAAGQAIILTVAHVFLDIATKDADIEVELFENGKPIPYPATLIGGNHNADLAFLKIQTSKIMPSVRLTEAAPKITKDQSLISFGCNNGSDPTRLETKVADINRYDGPANLVCTTDPVSGRSGGGLFNTSGQLVGVCSCADRKRREGLYMAYDPIMKLVQSLKLQSILVTPAGSVGEDAATSFQNLLAGNFSASEDAAIPVVTPSQPVAKTEPAFDEVPEAANELPQTSDEENFDSGDLSDAPLFAESRPQPAREKRPVALSEATATANGPRVTILIEDNTPGAQTKVIVIPQATPWMMELLTGESSEPPASTVAAIKRSAAEATSARQSTKSSKRTSQTKPLSQAP